MDRIESQMVSDTLLLLARLSLSALFLVEGIAKLNAWGPSLAYMQKLSVPGELLPAAVALELGAGAAVLLGWRTSFAALALAGFSIAAAVLFHNRLSDHGQALHFWKDIAIAGGFLALAVSGGGRWSLDGLVQRRAVVLS